MNRLIKWLLVFFPLLVGGLIYVGYRKKTLLMFKWFEYLGVSNLVEIYRNFIILIEPQEIIVYNLPNGLWSLSFIVFIHIIASNKLKKILYIVVVCIILGFEVFQLWFIPGTFCLYDFFTNLFFIILAFILIKGVLR